MNRYQRVSQGFRLFFGSMIIHPSFCQRGGNFGTDLWQNRRYEGASGRAVEMAFAIGILILVIAATTIVGAIVLSFMAAIDPYGPVDERTKARDGRASTHRDAADRFRAHHSTARYGSAPSLPSTIG